MASKETPSDPTEAKGSSPKEGNPCVDVLTKIVTKGDLDQASGLPAGCKKEEAIAVLGEPTEIKNAPLVVGRWLDRLEYGAAYGARRLAVWLDVDDTILMIEIDKPKVTGEIADLLKSLGDPDDIIRSRTGNLSFSYRDFVYAKRGLTLSVGVPIDDDEGLPPLDIGYIYLYAPTTVEIYIGELGGLEPKVRKFPKKR